MGHRRAAKNQLCLLFVQEISKCFCGEKKNRALLVVVFPQKHQFEGLYTREHTCKIARRKWIEELGRLVSYYPDYHRVKQKKIEQEWNCQMVGMSVVDVHMVKVKLLE